MFLLAFQVFEEEIDNIRREVISYRLSDFYDFPDF